MTSGTNQNRRFSCAASRAETASFSYRSKRNTAKDQEKRTLGQDRTFADWRWTRRKNCWNVSLEPCSSACKLKERGAMPPGMDIRGKTRIQSGRICRHDRSARKSVFRKRGKHYCSGLIQPKYQTQKPSATQKTVSGQLRHPPQIYRMKIYQPQHRRASIPIIERYAVVGSLGRTNGFVRWMACTMGGDGYFVSTLVRRRC